MNRYPLPLWFVTLAWPLSHVIAQAEVVTYPAPPGEALAQDYEVHADGKKVDVYSARTLDPPFAGKRWDFGGPYAFANFDTSGPVTVRITSKRSLGQTVVRPQSPGVQLKVVDEHTLSLTFDGPRKVSIEPEGKKGPLLLFANPPQRDVPKPGDPGVIYFGPGMHRPGKVDVGDGQTVYLAGGAVVKGAINARGSNIRIAGRGILDGSDYEWRKGPYGVTIGIQGANVTVEGITIRGSSHWTIVPRNSRHVTVRNVKLCNSRVQNDDGINPCNSQDVLITDCFIRSDDDCVALKGLSLDSPNNNVERITVEKCTLWCDRARIFLLGHESRAAFMREVTLRDLDIIHFSMTPFLLEPGEDMRLENVTVENVRIHGEGQGELIRLKPVVNQYMRKKVPGFIRNVRFKNMEVTGRPGAYQVQLAGADAEHDVGSVAFENVSILGKPLTKSPPQVMIGNQVEGVDFVNGTTVMPLKAARAVEVKVVSGGESIVKAADCRRMLVGPAVNQPDPHPGYAGFVGWDAPLRLRDGTLLVTFSTGYWHASPPTPLRIASGTLAEWRKLGMPTDIDAPRGGRAMLIRSTDDGRTWSKPQTIIDTPWDDRSPAIAELPDGTLVCSFFSYAGHGDFGKEPELAHRTGMIRSQDGGKTWEQTPRRLPSPFLADATDGPPVVLKDGSVLLAVYGSPKERGAEQVGVFRSSDGGQTWQLLSVIKTDHEMSETGLAQLPDGRLVMIARPEGDITWSSDGGRTWTKPVTFGMRMFEPGLSVLRDGTLLCLHGSYGAGGFRAIFSTDGGQTWVAPARNHGFAVDPSVYGYGRGVELSDGSVLAVYIHTGGHRTKDAQTEALWAIRLRVRPDHTGVDLLPAPGR